MDDDVRLMQDPELTMKLYSEATGCLTYFVVCTRSDLASSLSKRTKIVKSPAAIH